MPYVRAGRGKTYTLVPLDRVLGHVFASHMFDQLIADGGEDM